MLEETICRWSTRLAAASCTWLLTIAAFDRRQGWSGAGISSCAHWLALRCGLELRTAREQLATAHAMARLPAIRAALACGELSYSKVRAITRVARSENEAEWLELARSLTAGQLEQRVSRRRQQNADPAKLRAARAVAIRTNSDGSVRLVATLPPDDAAILLAALDAARSSLEAGRNDPASNGAPGDGEVAHAPRGQSRDADALIALAEAFLHHQAPKLQNSPHTFNVHVTAPGADEDEGSAHADETASEAARDKADVAGQGVPRNRSNSEQSERRTQASRGRRGRIPPGLASVGGWTVGLPAGMVSRLGCDGMIRALLTDRENNPLRLGRRSRLPTSRVRDAVYLRDEGVCRFPSCEHTRWLQIHHLDEWHADGGETNIERLLLVCGTHHRAIHDQNLALRRDHDGTVTVHASDGRVLLGTPPANRDSGSQSVLVPTLDPAILDEGGRYGLTA
ncbi:HNH endonuclease signature motif containing protein [Frankia umida]|uniref:HNH endonuclease signature motif containing protein n=1 Tax=Frankia umida TaxID=573489 RepID=UPI0020105C16|nr:HNH endonuclease signature motif containing protein [Frankia umida]